MMPLPGSSSRWLRSQPSRSRLFSSRSTPSRSDRRASGPRMVTTGTRSVSTTPAPADPTLSCSSTSATTREFAVAVVASTGTRSSTEEMRSRRRR